VSHLGEQLSALVDGELSGAALDRANAHVAACGACRVEANALRRLKLELRALGEVHDADGITTRLLAMTSECSAEGPAGLASLAYPAGPAALRNLGRDRGRRRELRSTAAPYTAAPYTAAPYSAAPYSAARSQRRLTGRRRGRYVLWSTLSLVVVGVSTAAFGMGGNSGATGPQITPQLEVFDIQHAITSGDIPFPDPTDMSTRVPVVATTP
jgi:anti-sigma factor RsiW